MFIKDYVFHFCSDFSARVLADLRGSPLRNASICGSILRREALPMSDVDVVLTMADFHTSSIEVDGVDRIDVLVLPDNAPTRLLSCRSPEAGFLDALPISGEKVTNPHYDCFNTRQNLLNKFLWEYTYSRVFNDRSDTYGTNLKYSPGCYRDVLLIDRKARAHTGQCPSAVAGGEPEVVEAARQVCDLIDIPANDVLESVAFVMLVKTTVLQAHAHTSHRGRTHVNDKTLATAMESSDSFASLVRRNQDEFWSMYQQSRSILDKTLRMAFSYATFQYSDLIYDDVRIALDAAQGRIVPDLQQLIEQDSFDTFPIAACVLNSKNTTQKTIQRMAERYHDDPGHQYTNRLIAKSRMVSKKTLMYMHERSMFSFDDWTNSRYSKMIADRIGYHK